MAAGLGFKTFTTGEVLTAADTNGYLMQGVLVFASSAARAAAITSPQEGQYSYLKDTNSTEYYDGAAWIAAPIGDITGVTAGTGISGGGTSGTVTVTNSMATEITAAGDIIVGTGSGTFDNLPIGTTNQVLTADTTVSPYKVKWATAAAGGAFTSLASGAMASSVSLTSISGSYTDLYLVMTNVVTSVNDQGGVRINNDTTAANYQTIGMRNINSTLTQQSTSSSFVQFTLNSSFMASTTGNSFVVYFPNYAQTTGYKMVNAQGYLNDNLSTFTTTSLTTGYKSTSAITRLDLVTAGSSWAVQGTYTLYGVK
jgi:hypothetical protein